MIIITRDYVKAIVALAWVNRFIALASRFASSSRVIGRRFSLLERFVQIKVFHGLRPGHFVREAGNAQVMVINIRKRRSADIP